MAVRPNWRVGYSTGLRYWLYFMIGFFLLGYSWGFSIVMGAIVGAAVSTISAWWNAKDDGGPAQEKTNIAVPEVEAISKKSPKREHFRRTGMGPGRLRPTRSLRRFGWLFRRNR